MLQSLILLLETKFPYLICPNYSLIDTLVSWDQYFFTKKKILWVPLFLFYFFVLEQGWDELWHCAIACVFLRDTVIYGRTWALSICCVKTSFHSIIIFFVLTTVEAESSESLVRTWMWSRSQKWGSPSVPLILSPQGGGKGVSAEEMRECCTNGMIITVHWRDGEESSQRRIVPRVVSVRSNRYIYVTMQK